MPSGDNFELEPMDSPRVEWESPLFPVFDFASAALPEVSQAMAVTRSTREYEQSTLPKVPEPASTFLTFRKAGPRIRPSVDSFRLFPRRTISGATVHGATNLRGKRRLAGEWVPSGHKRDCPAYACRCEEHRYRDQARVLK